MRNLAFASLLLFTVGLWAQNVEVIKFPELQKKILLADQPLTIFNFWATWCKPCIKEIPHFESHNSNPKISVYFVSLDYVENLGKVKTFVKENKLSSKVFLLDETDYDSYMGKVSKEWTGAIPATLFVDQWGKTYFHEKEFKPEDLQETINKYLN